MDRFRLMPNYRYYNIEGTSPLTLDKSVGKPLRDYKIYGNSIQDGTPTPESPVEVQSIGDLVTDAESEYYGKYAVPVKVCGNNLLDETAFGKFTNWKTAEYGEMAGGFNRFKVNCKPNTVYTVWLENQNGNIGFVTVGGSVKTIQASKMWQIQSNEGGYFYFRANVYNQKPLDNLINKIGNIQVIEGAYTAYTMPPYEPYHKPIATLIYLNEPLRKVGDYSDYIDFKRQKVVRNVTAGILDGSEEWKSSGKRFYYYNTNLNIKCLGDTIAGIQSNALPSRSWNSIRSSGAGIATYNIDNRIDIRADDFWENVSDAKEYMASNPIHYIAPCLTPIDEIIELPTFLTTKGTNIITVDTEVPPSKIIAQYYK